MNGPARLATASIIASLFELSPAAHAQVTSATPAPQIDVPVDSGSGVREVVPAPASVPHRSLSAPSSHWNASWPHAGPWDYTLAGVGATAATFELSVLQPIRPPLRWAKPILFDADVRNALRTTNPSTATTLENVSWGLWGAQLAYPLFVDVPFALAHHERQLAWDLVWQDVVTLTIAGAIDGGIRDLVGRARPGTTDCLDRSGGASCLSNADSTRSFPGGHLVNSTAATALTCTQHLYTKLYGGPWDGLVCATSVASDLSIAVMRVVSDNHYASDQLASLALGSLIGWGVPYIMHFRARARPEETDGSPAPTAVIMPQPLALDHGAGIGVIGIF